VKNRHGRSILAVAVAQALSVGLAQANPTGPSVAHGSASLSTSGKALTVTTAPGTVLNWQSFSIGAGELTRFQQSSALSAVLNRVVGRDPSSILGTLSSNGRVFLVNPQGIVFGRGSVIDTAGFVASTLNIADRDFLEGRLKFEGGASGVLRNEGAIRASGDIYLVGPKIENAGLIRSEAGSVLLAAGQSVTITSPDAQGVQFALQAPTDSALNLGSIEAKNAAAMFAGTLRHSGDIRANRVTLSATAEAVLEAGSTVAASGEGASVLVWSDDTARVHGTISAKGEEGKGGFVETSARSLDVNGARVDTGGGLWLIDPNDFTIAASGGNITGATLSANLGAGNAAILSSSGGTGSGDINVDDAVSWSANLLTLTAARDININAVMTASGTSRLALNPATANGADAAVAGGTVKVGMNGSGFTGRVDFPGRGGTGFLTINGNDYTVIQVLGPEGSFSQEDLQGMNGRLDWNYALGGNIDASTTAGWNAGLGFDPIAGGFNGRFNGLGHTIDNLTINRPTGSYLGLFSFASGAEISNVGLVNASITGNAAVGALVGYLTGTTISNSYSTGSVIGGTATSHDLGGLAGINAGTISNSYSTASVTGGASSYEIGGLAGYNNGTITYSNSAGAITGGSDVGGLVGYNASTISNSHSNSNVSGSGSHIGGLVGYNTLGSTITASHATGAVTADNLGQRYIGGLAGQNDGTIADSYSIAEVQAFSYAGGLVGYNDGAISGSYSTGIVTTVYQFAGGIAGYNDIGASISTSYSTAYVRASEFAGGLAAWNTGAIADSYNTGNTNGLNGSAGGVVGVNEGPGSITRSYSAGSVTGTSNTGGLVGWFLGGAVTNSYWDTATSGQSASPGGGTGLTTAQMKTAATFTAAGWDPTVWNMVDGAYPTLKAFASCAYGACWTGGASGDWSLASNWFGSHLPASGDSVFIDAPGLITVTYSGASTSSLGSLISNENFTLNSSGGGITVPGATTFGAGTTFTLASGTATFDGTTSLGSLDLQGGTLSGSGAITLNGTASTWSGGSIVGSGSLSMPGAAALALTGAGARILNGRTLDFGVFTLPGGSLDVQAGALNTTGTTTIGSGATLIASGGAISSALPINIEGTLRTGAGSVSATGITIASTGLLTGNGTVTGNVTNNGTVAPGNSAGTLTVAGNYTQGAGGTLDIELEGATAGQYDVLAVSGTATLDGTVNFSGGAASGSFPFLTASSISGAFANRTGTLNPTLAYSTGDITASLASLGIFWDGGGNDGLWLTPANWSGDALPAPSDDVTIGVSAGTVTLSSGTHSVNSLQCDANFALSGGARLTLWDGGGRFNGDLAMGAGTALTTYGRLNLNTYTLGAGAKIHIWQSGPGVLTIGGLPYIVINSLGAPGSTTGTDLQGMNGNLAGRYALGSDIDASATSTWNWNGSAYSGFTPVGDTGSQFFGVFDGLGHVIAGLSINRQSSNAVGLFGDAVGPAGVATIRNVGLEGGNVSGNLYVGALVGNGRVDISNSYSAGSVSGIGGFAGGLVGYNGATIGNSYATGSVRGGDYVGGLVGWNGGSIINSYATGSVSGVNEIGGLVGFSRPEWVPGIISDSYATGSVSGINGIGGLAGGNASFSVISNTHATGSVSGNNDVGGLVGRNGELGAAGEGGGTIRSSYATGGVGGFENTGGLVGFNTGTISNSYANGSVSGADYAGGLVGLHKTGSITKSYSTGGVTGNSYVGGLVGQSLGSLGGSITESYATGSVIGAASTNDIGGLVGYNGGAVANSYATGSVTGSYEVGGLVGFNTGTISNSYAAGSVSGVRVGGLVGYNAGTIRNSYWDTETSGRLNCAQGGSDAGCTGLTNSQISQRASFPGWNFSTVWGIEQGASYPYLLANPQIPHPMAGPAYFDSERATALGLPANDVRALTDQFFAAVIGINLPADEREKGTALVCK
jgi:filamentous hemagglutinin family protein